MNNILINSKNLTKKLTIIIIFVSVKYTAKIKKASKKSTIDKIYQK